jgi:predicted ester cyclase
LFATNLVDHAVPPGLAPDIEGLKQLVSAYFNAFPDLQVTIEDTIAEGDKVMTRLTWRGTHRGELMGMPPTGKQVAFSVMESYRPVGSFLTNRYNRIHQPACGAG